MKLSQNKVVSLRDAVSTYVKQGCHLSIGGFTINRNPMAAVYEIIRQKITDIHLYAHSNGQAVDELIGAGCISKLEIAYGGSGKFASTCIRFRKAVEDGTIEIEDYTNYQMTLRFMAGAMGIPFLPTRSSLGSDIINKWGFSEEMREKNCRIPDQKLIVMENPFTCSNESSVNLNLLTDRIICSGSTRVANRCSGSSWCDVSKVVLVPAINPDVTIIHVQQADQMGNCRIDGLSFADVEQAKSAHHVIVTCEKVSEGNELKKESEHNVIPFIHVDAVVPVPHGAYPTACYRYYDYDPKYLKMYAEYARDDKLLSVYISQFITGVADHQALIDYIGMERMALIKADPERGYAVNLDRS